MHRRKKSLNTVIILAVLFVLFMGARARQKDEVMATRPSPEEAGYAERGSYPVGMLQLTVEAERLLEAVLWYPAVNGEELEEITRYSYGIKMDDPLGTVTLAKFAGQSLRRAPYDLSAAPYPLVILSPGFSIGATAYGWLAEHLASYGFVVIAPEHAEHLDPENELWQSAIRRPQDILAVLAYLDEQVEPEGMFAGLIDPDRVAVVGHSYGGYTSLAAAGARFDTGSFISHCEQAQEADHPAAWLCDQLLPHITDMASLAGLDSLPEELWPAWTDPRVDAVVSMAGDAFFFGQAGLAEIGVPVLAVGGTLDNDSPFAWGTQPTYEYVSSLKKIKIALTDAEHMIFTGPCESVTWYLKFFSGEFCSDAGWDRYYAHDLMAHFTTAFLLAELKQDAGAAVVLAPERVRFPGLTYEAQGY